MFTQFWDDQGWGSEGLATLVAIIGPVVVYIGSDCAVHLAEELLDASYVLPRAMVIGSLANYILGFAMTVTFMCNLGDIHELFESRTGQPWVALIFRITKSRTAAIVLVVLMITLCLLSAISQVTASSRQVSLQALPQPPEPN